MKVAAVTITYNRLELTKKTIDSFYQKTGVDYHVFVDNGSTDGTREFLQDYNHIAFEENQGIAYAFATACKSIPEADYVLKLDNDIETVTPGIIETMLEFYYKSGGNYVVSPVDLNLDPRFAPIKLKEMTVADLRVRLTSHTGGAFQLIPWKICQKLCKEYRHLAKGDYMIGHFFRRHNYHPAYLLDLEMKHIGLNKTVKNYIL